MKKIRWGIIGCGGIAARRTIPEFKEMAAGAEIVSVMDIDVKRAEEVACRFRIPHYCSDEEELLKKDIDAVYIATPQNAHCRQTVLAARAGRHVLCEKPIALSLDEVDEMQDACEKASVKFMLGFCMRNNVYNAKARELVKSGCLGRIVMTRAQLTCWFPPMPGVWRQDAEISRGGALIDMGTHCLDLLEWITGEKIAEVAGFQDMLVHEYRTRIEDTSTIVLRFEGGSHGIVDNYFNLPDASAQNALEIHGTKGSITGRRTIGQDPTGEMFSIIQPQETGYDASQNRDMDVARNDYKLEGKGLYGQMINVFSDCIINDTAPPVTIQDGRHSVRVVESIYAAVREKRTVKVED